MKSTLEFNLPEDAAEHRHAIRGAEYLAAIRELVKWLRDERKYRDVTHEAESALWDILNDANIDPYD